MQCSICVKVPAKDFRETASFVRTPESRYEAWKLRGPSYRKTKKNPQTTAFTDINPTQLYMLQDTRIIITFYSI